jgi:hypothetical protein
MSGFQSDYIDLAISVAVVFFLSSLVVSGLNEGVTWATRIRSKFLWSYLHDLCDPSRVKTLPRGFAGLIGFTTPKQDRRPMTVPIGTFTPPLLEPRQAAAAATAGETGAGATVEPAAKPEPTVDVTNFLQHLARALDPLDAPQATGRNKTATDEQVAAAEQTRADAATGRPSTRTVKPAARDKTSIQHVPAGSLAQAFLEVFAEVGKEQLTDALTEFGQGLQQGRPVDHAVIRAVHTLVGSEASTAGDLNATFQVLIAATQAATDEDAASQAKEFAERVRQIDGAHRAAELGDTAVAFVAAVRSGGDVHAAADGLWRPLGLSFPDNFPRQRVEAAVRSMQDSPLGPTARRLWEASNRRLDDFRNNLESYFDQEMTRVSGYYKRSIRWILLVFAILIAVVSNIDAIGLVRDLWRNPGGRATLVMQADALNTASSGGAPADDAALAALRAKCEDRGPKDDNPSAQDIANGFNDVRDCITDALSATSGLDVINRAVWISPSRWADDWTETGHYHWIVHPLGVALTVVALVLGAPFWFDLLKRLTGIRRGLVGQT